MLLNGKRDLKQTDGFWGLIMTECNQMAAVGVISKYKKAVGSPFLIRIFSNHIKYIVFGRGSRFFCKKPEEQEKFDVVIIGGGSGGLACAKEAKNLGASVCLIDYVSPTPKGTTWGLGGTCVNVGCIPKKLMHQAALLGEAIQDAVSYGWDIKNHNEITINWAKLKKAVKDHIKSVNWVTRVSLRENKIEYINGLAKFIETNVLEVTTKDKVRQVHGDNIVIAAGGRPRYPNIPGAIELGVTSDDIFSLPDPPKRTLVVGAGYVGLECAGFLNTFKFPVTVMVRSVVLRSFDRQMANLLMKNLVFRGIKFLNNAIPKSVEKSADGFLVTYETVSDKGVKTTEKEVFDTVLFATGRRPLTKDLNLDKVGIKIDPETEKIITNNENTSVSKVYAVGDVIHGKPELTPVATEAGKLLARRMLGKSEELMDYNIVPTTVFTPLEYGCVGLSEESAIAKYDENNLEVYHTFYKPTEYFIPQKQTGQCYMKVICFKENPQKILGMHFIGPTAGEVIQGYAAAMRANFTMSQLTKTIGIHPTVSEEFTRLSITKRSGIDPIPPSCCF